MTTADYLSRLAVALPLILALLAAGWYAVKRGWVRPPGIAAAGPAVLRPVATLGLGPATRLVVVEFDGRRLLLGISRAGVELLDSGRG